MNRSRDLLAELVDLGDLDELLRHVDRLSDSGEWDDVADLRRRCLAALATGRQLWPVASHAEYRMALGGPGRLVAAVLEPGTGRFALGPLAEVAAARHAWHDVAPWLGAGEPTTAVFAHERVVRGEDLRDALPAGAPGSELPLVLSAWEPAYPLADYAPHEAHFPMPHPPPASSWALAPRRGVEVAPHRSRTEACRALVDVATAWTTESNGRAEAAEVDGSALAAIWSLGAAAPRVATVAGRDAMALLAWTAASGGAHGRRRGAASGRFAAWWAVAAMCEMLDEWPPDAERLGDAVTRMRWWLWDAGEPDTGWVCRVAAEDPATGRGWALMALDAR